MSFSIINGQLSNDASIALSNKSFRYGDGFFETMRHIDGKLLLANDHFNRFYSTAKALGYDIPAGLTPQRLQNEISELCSKNNCPKARIRLSAWRGEAGLLEGDDTVHYAIECGPMEDSLSRLNENGLVIGIYTDARKQADHFSQYKSASFHPYQLAARKALQMKWNDAIVLNNEGRIADTCIANLFILRKGKLITPPLFEGGVAGVMRQHIIRHFDVTEKPVSPQDLETADEIFLTNAIRIIRWVGRLGEQSYGNTETARLYAQLQATF